MKRKEEEQDESFSNTKCEIATNQMPNILKKEENPLNKKRSKTPLKDIKNR